MKIIRRISILIVILVGIAIVYRFLILGSFIDEEDAVGLTQSQVNAEYGEPDWVIEPSEDDGSHWVYFHGMRSSSVEFKDGVVIAVHQRTR